MNDLDNVGEQDLDSKLSSEKESGYLQSDTREINKRIVSFYDQTINQRKYVMCIAVVVMLCLGVLEITILCNWMKWNVSDVDYFVVIAVSPIVSITAISITLLIGVYHGLNKSQTDAFAGLLGKIVKSSNNG